MFSRLFSFFLSCFSCRRRFEWMREFEDNRKTKRLLNANRLSYVIFTLEMIVNATMQFLWEHWVIQINHSVLSQRHYYRSRHAFHSGIDIKIRIVIRIICSHHQSSMIVSLEIIGGEIALANSYLNPSPRSLPIEPRKVLQESCHYVKSGHAIVEIELQEIIV